MAPILISRTISDTLPAESDFCCFWKTSDFLELAARSKHADDDSDWRKWARALLAPNAKRNSEDSRPQTSLETEVSLQFETDTGILPAGGIAARAVFVPCANRTAISATFRLLGDWKPSGSKAHRHVTKLAECTIPADPNHVVSARLIAEVLQPLLIPAKRGVQGLVVISGATNCAKSDTTRNCILQFLLNLIRETKAHPHLVTYEDPIEDKWLLDRPADGVVKLAAGPTLHNSLWLTPRAAKPDGDATSLEEAVTNALRQSPTVFYVGEVRADDDWKHVLFLAGTGHLVVATTHAGSLSETWSRLLNAQRAVNEADRAYLARRVLGIAHLIKPKVRFGEHGSQLPGAPEPTPPTGVHIYKPVLMPTVWQQTPEAVAAMAADGLSSTSPNGAFVKGRAVVAHMMSDYERLQGAKGHVLPSSFRKNEWDLIKEHALKLDWRDF